MIGYNEANGNQQQNRCFNVKEVPEVRGIFWIKKSTANRGAIKITMDRQGKSTGIEKQTLKCSGQLQTQHHDHKPKAIKIQQVNAKS